VISDEGLGDLCLAFRRSPEWGALIGTFRVSDCIYRETL